jgi:hypothetical protein
VSPKNIQLFKRFDPKTTNFVTNALFLVAEILKFILIPSKCQKNAKTDLTIQQRTKIVVLVPYKKCRTGATLLL